MAQTSINPIGQPAAVAGLVADNEIDCDFIAGFSENESASIPFGTVVKQGTAPQGVLSPSSSEDVFVGVLAQDFTHAPGEFGDIDTAGVGIVPEGQCKILRKGRIWTVVDAGTDAPASINPRVDRPYVRYAAHTNYGSVVGAVSNASDVDYNTDMTRCGVFMSPLALAADGVTPIAIVDWDFTNRPT